MEQTIFYLALVEAGLTVVLARAALNWLGSQRWVGATMLSGLALPVLAAAGAWLFLVLQPSSQQGGAGMMFAMVALLALYALPVCLISAAVTTLVLRTR